jgi:histidine ammonia-lyase
MIAIGGDLSVPDVVAVARENERVELDRSAAEAMRESRRVVRELVDGDRRVYGVNTGYGEMKDVAIPRAELQTQQLNLLRSHNVTVGSQFPLEVIRAAMLIRANVLAQGYSGVRVELVDTLLALLNRGIHPVLRTGGNTDNAAGLANVGLVLAGEGQATVEGDAVAGETALQHAGVESLTLQAKEGLALISGTATMTALLSFGVHDAGQLIDTADVNGAWVFELIGKQPGAFDPDVAAVHPQPGQETSARNVRALSSNEATSTHMSQDPLSIRCIPQIHGAARQFLDIARRTVETELGSLTSSPT